MRKTFLTAKSRIILAVAVMVLGFGQTAGAVLNAVGPVNPATGFPTSFTAQGFDTVAASVADITLGPCDTINPDFLLGVNNPPCSGLALVDFNGAFVQGNIEEVSFYRIESLINLATGERFLLRMEVQGGVLPPELVSNAIRIRLRGLLQTGTYTITTPLDPPNDTFTINVPAGTPIADVDDSPAGADGVAGTVPPFSGALPGPMGPFPSNGTGFTDPVTGEIFYGDGITEAALVGPFAGRAFTVQRPDGTSETNTLFSVEGKVLNVAVGAVNVTGATYSRTAAGSGLVSVFATGPTGAGVSLTASGAGIPSEIMVGDAFGNYFSPIEVPAPFTPPASVAVTQNSTPPAVGQGLLKDLVSITSATYNTAIQRLTINAVSSDKGSPAPALTSASFGALTGGSLIVEPLAVPPAQVTVTSSAGGADTSPVSVINIPPDVVTITRATVTKRANVATATWAISGTGVPGAIISVTLDGAPIGASVTVGRTGLFRINARNSTVVPSAAQTNIRATSSGLGTDDFAFLRRGTGF